MTLSAFDKYWHLYKTQTSKKIKWVQFDNELLFQKKGHGGYWVLLKDGRVVKSTDVEFERDLHIELKLLMMQRALTMWCRTHLLLIQFRYPLCKWNQLPLFLALRPLYNDHHPPTTPPMTLLKMFVLQMSYLQWPITGSLQTQNEYPNLLKSICSNISFHGRLCWAE